MLLLMPSAWLVLFLLFREAALQRKIGGDWRLSFILASAAWGGLLSAGTEILSLATSLNAPCVRLFWLLLNAALWALLYYLRRPKRTVSAGGSLGGGLKEIQTWPWDARVMLGAAGLFAVFLGIVALLTPTTNWDSLTYHMARVMHWIQQQSVAHYPTNMEAQLQMGPWSGFVQTHLWLLWGSDRFENMLQWSAMAGSMVVATVLVSQMVPGESAGNARAQAFAALLVATLPTGIVESISTQTDYTTGFWLMCLTSLGLAWYREPVNRIYAIGFGLALGLGVMSKFTMIFYATPIGVAMATALFWKQRATLREVVLPVVVALAICLGVVLPHFARNQSAFGSIIGSQATREGAGIPSVSFAGVLSNLIRNIELHSNTGMPPLTHQLNRLAHKVQSWTGRAPDDPQLSNPSSMYEPPDEFFVFDSFAASSWHVALIGIAIVVGLANLRKNRLAVLGLGLAFAGFVLFCVGLRWQIWNSRYHLPVLLLCLPMTGSILAPRIRWWLTCFAGTGLLVFAMAIVTNNRSRPIFDSAWRSEPRLQQLLSFQGVKLFGDMQTVAGNVVAAGCIDVGLKLAPDYPEYPFWLMLREAGFRGEIHHQLVSGPTANLPGSSRMPDVIITTLSGQPSGQMAKAYPIQTEIGPFTLHWLEKISERTKGAKQL